MPGSLMSVLAAKIEVKGRTASSLNANENRAERINAAREIAVEIRKIAVMLEGAAGIRRGLGDRSGEVELCLRARQACNNGIGIVQKVVKGHPGAELEIHDVASELANGVRECTEEAEITQQEIIKEIPPQEKAERKKLKAGGLERLAAANEKSPLLAAYFYEEAAMKYEEAAEYCRQAGELREAWKLLNKAKSCYVHAVELVRESEGRTGIVEKVVFQIEGSAGTKVKERAGNCCLRIAYCDGEMEQLDRIMRDMEQKAKELAPKRAGRRVRRAVAVHLS